jgi:hypothetical protein
MWGVREFMPSGIGFTLAIRKLLFEIKEQNYTPAEMLAGVIDVSGKYPGHNCEREMKLFPPRLRASAVGVSSFPPTAS